MTPDAPRRSPPRPGFVLSKWYLDCVAGDGTAFLGYHARLAHRRVRVDYASTLLCTPSGVVRSAVSMRRSDPPSVEGRSVRWSHPTLAVDGDWDAAAPPIAATLLADGRGVVRWRCLQPLARAAVRIGAAGPVAGFGYCEVLELTIAPWRLPIEELRWGHLLAPDAGVVWIDWRGARPLTRVYLEGTELRDFEVADETVTGPGLRVALTDHRVLREGSLAATALSGVAPLARLLSPRGFSVHERKWLSRGEALRTRRDPARGWAVSEVVRMELEASR